MSYNSELTKLFGQSARQWATNLIIAGLILYVMIRKKR